MSFRLNAGHCLLTYSRCTHTKEEVRDHLVSLLGAKLKRLVVCQELHQDGHPHIHAAVKFTHKVNFRRANMFDYQGTHPNIRTGQEYNGTFEGAERYVSKYGDIVEHGAPTEELIESPSSVCATMATKIAWIEYCIEKRIAPAYCESIWSLVHADTSTTIDHHEPIGTMVPSLRDLPYGGNNIVLIGPSGCGKSTWAKYRAPKPALWVTHLDDLKKFNRKVHKSIIFDDMSFVHLPEQSQIHLVDPYDQRSIHVRYGTVTIPAGVPKIFTGNVYPFTEVGEHAQAIRRRVHKYIVQ